VTPHLNQLSFLQDFATMAAQQDRPQLPKFTFRVLIIGRANAGKTSILQRVCDTTESPEIYKLDPSGTRYRVRPQSQKHRRSHLLARFNSTLQRRLCMFLCLVSALIADRDNVACSVAYMISTTNSSSPATTAMFSMTHAALRQAAKTS